MRELKASSKEGQRVIGMFNRCVYYDLRDIYYTYSGNKANEYNRCRQLYRETEGSTNWGIASCGTFAFIAGWAGYKEGEQIVRVETRDNSYLVWLDR